MEVASADGVGPPHYAFCAELADGAAGLIHCRVDIGLGHDGDGNEPFGVGFGEVVEPVVVGAAEGGGDLGVLDGGEVEARGGEHHGGVHALVVHVFEAGERVAAALAPPRGAGVRVAGDVGLHAAFEEGAETALGVGDESGRHAVKALFEVTRPHGLGFKHVAI